VNRHLLDVNVLVSLLDPTHVHHERAHRWFADRASDGWDSCPITQNGVLRIVSNPRYSNAQPLSAIFASMSSLLSVGDHRFLSDSISLFDGLVDSSRLLSSGQVTDSYLLALAMHSAAKLATFDTKIVTEAVAGGSAAVTQIP
jgi:toxin-antitoxin system PIN domain toxin